MQLYATAQYVSEPLVCAAQLCNYHTLLLGDSATSKDLPPFEVKKVMCGLVAIHGMAKVRVALQHATAAGAFPKMMHNMVSHIIKYRCHGFRG